MLIFLLSTLAAAAPTDRWEVEGVKAAEHGSHAVAVATFAKVLAADPDASKSRYWLGRSLLELELTESATAELVELVESGPSDPFFRYALQRLSDLTAPSGDGDTLGRLALKIPEPSWPAGARSALALAAGLLVLERGEPDLAVKLLGQVSEKSPGYPEALLATGRARAANGDYKSAIRAWKSLASTARTTPTDPQAALKEATGFEPVPFEALWRDAADRAILDWDTLSKTVANTGAPPLDDVPERSVSRRRAQVAAARRDLAAGSAKAALARFEALRPAFFRRAPPADWQPEAAVLEARAYLARCETRHATRALDRGAAERDEVDAWLTGKRRDVDGAPEAVRVHLAADRSWAVLARHLAAIDEERKRLASLSDDIGATAARRVGLSLDDAERSVSRRLQARQVVVLDALSREAAAAAEPDAAVRAALTGPCTPG